MLNSRIIVPLAALIAVTFPALANESVAPTVKAKRPARELVVLVIDTPDSALEKLNFVELYFLKNAVMANSGYVFADDRWWLKEFFAEGQGAGLAPCKPKGDVEECRIVPSCAQGCTTFDLSQFSFPVAGAGFSFLSTAPMNLAMARIRQIQFKKLRSITNENQLNPQITKEIRSMPKINLTFHGAMDSFDNDYPFVLGRVGAHYSESNKVFQTSLIRDLKGDLSLLRLVDQFKQDKYEFDLAELLGMYLWNLDLLKKVILARSGRTFKEPLKTELEKLGVEPSTMSVGNLSADAKEALSRLDLAIKSLVKGELNDVPESLRVGGLKIEDAALSYSGGM